MPRTARLVDVNMPYHICQRGNCKQAIFYDNNDKEYYLELLKSMALRYEMSILAYCLMKNHVHLIVIPKNDRSLSMSFRGINGTYGFYFNRKYGKSGHVWGDRYFSKSLDSKHLAIAVRYVERNPVRTGLVKKSEDWRWSSARGHLEQEKNIIISDDFFKYTEISKRQWKEYLTRSEYSSELNIMRKK
ncbi:MAG: transposase [Candidatus Firestonebacteria bacterium]